MTPKDPHLPTVFTRSEALRHGLTSHQVQQRGASGRWRRIGRGAYCLTQTWDDADRAGRHLLLVAAAMAQALPDHVVSHASAAVLHGLPLPFGRTPVWLTRPPDGCTRYEDGVQVLAASLPAHHVTRRSGHAVTSLGRTVADCLRHLPLVDAVAVADAAVHGEPMLRTAVPRVLDETHAWPLNGRGRAAWQLVDGRRESPAESWSFVALHRQCLPVPEPQVRVHDEHGRFVARVDAWWDELGVVGEVDGETKYGWLDGDTPDDARRRLVEEKRREDALRALDVVVLRWGTRDLRDERRWAGVVRAGLARGDRRRFRGRVVRTAPR